MIDERTRQDDTVALALSRYAQNVLVVIFGLLPLLFLPSVTAPFDYTKVFIVVTGLLIALVLYSLSVLRSGTFSLGFSYPLIALWGVAGVALISSLLSGDLKDSLVGDFFSIHATVFVAILALIPTVWTLLRSSKASVMRMYVLFAASTLVLVAFHLSRLVFGYDTLSFGIFTSPTSTPVGSWNDLALFLGLTVILSLIALEQLTLTRVGRILFAVVTFLSLFMLGVINFFMVWLVLGLTSLVMIVYALGKDRFMGGQLSFTHTTTHFNSTGLAVTLVVFGVSALFVVGGATLGGLIANKTNVSYLEVRPSLEATADIAQNVYATQAFLGIGPNKFTDAWRMFKDDSINQTPFWNTEFNAGNGYLTTFFVTTGVLGGIAWTLFLLSFIATGVRRLLGASDIDKMWYFIGVSSFVSAIYIWGMSVVYVPGVVILLLGALCTGVSISAFSVLNHAVQPKTISFGADRRTGFLLTLMVIMVIVGSVSIFYVAGRHYSSVYAFNESVQLMQEGKDIDEIEQKVESAYRFSSSDVFARRIAEYQLARMNGLIAKASQSEPTDEDRKQFDSASVTGINAAQQAIQLDDEEPANYSVLAGIYSVLASINVEGAQARALEVLAKSRELNPKSPLPYLESAIVEGRGGNVDTARSYIEKAIAFKPNYTEAFFFLSQLEIATGNVDAAIQSTQSVIALDPKNPARYYQLGVLKTAKGDTDGAIASFEQAILFDQNFANARYLLALAYDLKGKSDEAKKQLEVVLNLNPGNSEVTELLNILNNEGSLQRLRQASTTQTTQVVDESMPVTEENGTVRTTNTTDTNLVNSVNTVPKVEESAP